MGWHDGSGAVSFIPPDDNMIRLSSSAAVMPIYRCRCVFPLLLHLVIGAMLLNANIEKYSMLFYVYLTCNLPRQVKHPVRKIIIGNKIIKNITFIMHFQLIIPFICLIMWLVSLLLLCGDIHENPGPDALNTTSTSSISSTEASSYITIDPSSNLSVLYYNVQSIYHKLDLLRTELFHFDILAFSETWLNSKISTDDLIFPSYNKPERKDREDGYGGVIVYVKESLNYKRRQDLENPNLESIWIELNSNKTRTLIGSFYRPPNSDSLYYDMIEDSITKATDTQIKNIFILGDLNLNILTHTAARKIELLCMQFGLKQIINEPTNYTENSSSIIDLIMTSCPENIINSGVADPILNQDVRYHCPIYTTIRFTKPKAQSYKRRVWLYQRGDYTRLRDTFASINWSSSKHSNIDIYAKNITNKIYEISNVCIPNKSVTVRPYEPPWINANIKRLIRIRKRAFKKAKRTNSDTDWTNFRRIRNEVVYMIRNAKNTHYNNLSDKLTSGNHSNSNWWTVLKGFINPNTKSAIPPLTNNDTIVTDQSEKANLLNDYFVQQTYLNELNHALPVQPINNNIPTLEQPFFSPTDVYDILNALPLGKASGPDEINTKILRETASQLASPLCELFNTCISTCQFPSIWKEANVCPIFKKDDPSLVNNYRPISLLSIVGKVFERLLFNHIYNYLHRNNLLSAFQSGFRPGDSTINQSLYLYNSFCEALDSGKDIRIVFFDISKAFDRVWHKGLIHKLKCAGLCDELCLFFENYLNNRRQRVVIPNGQSNWKNIKAGVPQGSILGPLLFLVYINDLVLEVNSHIRLFADDTCLYLIVGREHEVPNASITLNNDIIKINEWANRWLVTFNPTKTELLTITRKTNKLIHPPLMMGNQQIADKTCHKHLGLYLSNDCSWGPHIKYILEKAWFRLNVMRRLKHQLCRKALETIYFSFILPILEYGDQIWDNCNTYEKLELDKIQNEAARIVSGTNKLVSLQKLQLEVGWDPLQNRRNKHKLILFYKMVNGLTPRYLSSIVPPAISSVSNINLRNRSNLTIPATRTSLYNKSFLPSVTRAWNNLPLDIRQANSLALFKKYINRDIQRTPKHYYYGKRKEQSIHARLRTQCSSLKEHLFRKNIIDSPLCACGEIETSQHYLLSCSLYNDARTVMINSVSIHCNITHDILLFGSEDLHYSTNCHIFEAVHEFIRKTNRFN